MPSGDIEETVEYQNYDKNMFINKSELYVFYSRYIDFLSKFSAKAGGSSQPDFLAYDIYGYADVYEIKKSDVDLLKYDSSNDNYYWSPDVSKVILRLEKYIYTCTRNKLSIEESAKVEKGIDINIIRQKGILIIGSRSRLTDIAMQNDFEILRSSLKNIEIILYDEMFVRLKNLKISALKLK